MNRIAVSAIAATFLTIAGPTADAVSPANRSCFLLDAQEAQAAFGVPLVRTEGDSDTTEGDVRRSVCDFHFSADGNTMVIIDHSHYPTNEAATAAFYAYVAGWADLGPILDTPKPVGATAKLLIDKGNQGRPSSIVLVSAGDVITVSLFARGQEVFNADQLASATASIVGNLDFAPGR